MTDRTASAQDTPCGDILAIGRDDWVSMADVQALISAGHLANSVPDRQDRVVKTAHSLLTDRLVEIGEIPGRNDPDGAH